MAEQIDYDRLVVDARAFLTDLTENNSRDWFRLEKTRYDTQLKRPAERLLADLASDVAKLADGPVKTKLFRPHRDVRFSKDKTPYHTHLHMMWSLPDGRAWFFGVSPDYTTFGAGLMGFDEAQLGRWRRLVGADISGVALTDLLSDRGWRLDDPALKRVPQPFEQDHPRAMLLRRKGLVVWQDALTPDPAQDPKAAITTAIEHMAPLTHWLQQVATSDTS